MKDGSESFSYRTVGNSILIGRGPGWDTAYTLKSGKLVSNSGESLGQVSGCEDDSGRPTMCAEVKEFIRRIPGINKFSPCAGCGYD
jgi:hypothetical protein